MAVAFGEFERRNAETLISLALEEDLGTVGDLTSLATIPESALGSAILVARCDGVISGLPVVEILADRMGLAEGWIALAEDGDHVAKGQPIARVDGSMRSILKFERTALNFLQRLSGIATLTSRFVKEVEGTAATILDTRKTTPGWRALEKYAIRCGGGQNHRIGLYDAVLIKDNHLASLTASLGADLAIPSAVESARAIAPSGTIVEVEVDTLEQFDQALTTGPDIILLDNFGPDELRIAVDRRNQRNPGVQLEASGGVNLTSVRALAETGVDRISVGALTHSAPSLDIALDYV